mmetsp:Transcript_61218/g.200096  ORF Transcript_61218/g.200096 Transcript_61218/m.200096 type:complete len:281 (+) Transcript_61218:3335-4177(+)
MQRSIGRAVSLQSTEEVDGQKLAVVVGVENVEDVICLLRGEAEVLSALLELCSVHGTIVVAIEGGESLLRALRMILHCILELAASHVRLRFLGGKVGCLLLLMCQLCLLRDTLAQVFFRTYLQVAVGVEARKRVLRLLRGERRIEVLRGRGELGPAQHLIPVLVQLKEGGQARALQQAHGRLASGRSRRRRPPPRRRSARHQPDDEHQSEHRRRRSERQAAPGAALGGASDVLAPSIHQCLGLEVIQGTTQHNYKTKPRSQVGGETSAPHSTLGRRLEHA